MDPLKIEIVDLSEVPDPPTGRPIDRSRRIQPVRRDAQDVIAAFRLPRPSDVQRMPKARMVAAYLLAYEAVISLAERVVLLEDINADLGARLAVMARRDEIARTLLAKRRRTELAEMARRIAEQTRGED